MGFCKKLKSVHISIVVFEDKLFRFVIPLQIMFDSPFGQKHETGHIDFIFACALPRANLLLFPLGLNSEGSYKKEIDFRLESDFLYLFANQFDLAKAQRLKNQ
jgi:hypothetical protein